MTLIFWQFFPLPLVDYNKSYPTQQDSKLASPSEKPLITDTRHYRDILVTKKDIIEMVREQFTTYRIASQIPKAILVLGCESSFEIDPPHNNRSRGVAQFTPETWSDFGYGDIFNPYWQIQTMAKMWSLGLQNRWDCY